MNITSRHAVGRALKAKATGPLVTRPRGRHEFLPRGARAAEGSAAVSFKARLIVLLLLFLLIPPASTDPARAVSSFVGDFERGDVSGWDTRQGAQPDSIAVVRDPVRCGDYACRFTVRPGERVSNGNRAELTHDNRDAPGSEGWYAWSFLVPSDFEDTEWKPKIWQCLGQWHDQPDTDKGETWKTFPGHSPSIAVYYLSKNGEPSIEVWYGPTEPQRIVARAPIRKGEWMDMTFHIGWSQDERGFMEAWLNNAPITPQNGDGHKVTGANMWNSQPHFLKIGLYRTDRITTTNSVYFDEVRIGNTRDEVAPMLKVSP
jgi:hypothetical protein